MAKTSPRYLIGRERGDNQFSSKRGATQYAAVCKSRRRAQQLNSN